MIAEVGRKKRAFIATSATFTFLLLGSGVLVAHPVFPKCSCPKKLSNKNMQQAQEAARKSATGPYYKQALSRGRPVKCVILDWTPTSLDMKIKFADGGVFHDTWRSEDIGTETTEVFLAHPISVRDAKRLMLKQVKQTDRDCFLNFKKPDTVSKAIGGKEMTFFCDGENLSAGFVVDSKGRVKELTTSFVD